MTSPGRPERLRRDAERITGTLPPLLAEAERLAHTVVAGVHGRRRAGPGETFWQFRHFEDSDAPTAIDWRRSASSRHLFVREREWEAAHTVWLWIDLSPSMDFRSHLSPLTKADRAVILALALSEQLVRGGERVGLIGGPAWTSRAAMRLVAERLVQQARTPAAADSLPPQAALTRFSGCVFFSDFLEPLTALAPRLESLARQGVRGHLVQVMDPAEETLPYEGRTEFAASEGDERMIAGRAETLRQRYQDRIAAHRQALTDFARRLEWPLLVHHTDRPAEEALLALHTRLAGLEQDYRHRPRPAAAAAGPVADVTP